MSEFFDVASLHPHSDEYVKALQKMHHQFQMQIPTVYRLDETPVPAPKPDISEMRATIVLTQITNEMRNNVGVQGSLQVAGRRCIMGELAYRLGLLEGIAKEHGHSMEQIGGSARTVMVAMGGLYSDEFRDMLVRMVGMNDSGVTWGLIGKEFGLAA